MAHARLFLVAGATLAFALVGTLAASANVALTQVSTDPYTNTTSFHKTEVEPDTFSNGSTLVSTFQAGRFQDGGSSNIGWSRFDGTAWTSGFLPGLTVNSNPAGTYDRATDPSVAYDAKHGVWLINSLTLTQRRSGIKGAAVVVNRSTDGGASFGNPVNVAVAGGGHDFDKNWIACDNTSGSAHYGNCYVEWDDHGHNNQLMMAVSGDGGLTWTLSSVPRRTGVIGGQPLVQPNGTVVVPIDNAVETAIESFVSTDGGASYTGPYSTGSISNHAEAGNLRSGPLPTAEIDSAGKVYVVWSDCRFETSCTANDLVMSTSTNGTGWSTPARIPIDAVASGVDHFLPGLAVDQSTSGSTAHLGLTYYYYPNTSCSTSNCDLDVGFVSSSDGGGSWTAPTQLAGPMKLSALPLTSQGYMVGDYMSTSFVGGLALPVFAIGNGTTCTLGNITSCNEPMEAPSSGLAPAAVATTAVRAEPIRSTASDHMAAEALTHR